MSACGPCGEDFEALLAAAREHERGVHGAVVMRDAAAQMAGSKAGCAYELRRIANREKSRLHQASCWPDRR
jgi:hypothetical protein